MGPSPSIRKPTLARPLQRRRRTPSSRLLINTLRVLVTVCVLWYEYGTFWSHTRSCTWDDAPSTLVAGVKTPTTPVGEPFHSLVLGDPQLLDMRSYPGRGWLARWLGVRITEAYARKSWRFAIRSKGTAGRGVDGVVWLGDLLDSGFLGLMDTADHASYVHRFHLLFPLPRTPRPKQAYSSLSPPIPSIYLPGNHDLGLHLASDALEEYSRERFTAEFGPTNGEKEWGGWSFVWVDSMALLEVDEVGNEARKFVEEIGGRPNTLPRVLLTHIPLFRPEGTSCGSARESKRSLRQGTGLNYQNMMDKEASDWLLRTLVPTLVYSGDDHDSCIVEHPFSSPASLLTSVRETTVKAFSMAMGIRTPGYHLLTTWPSSDLAAPSTFTQVNCTLPDQIGIWLHVYLPLLALVVSILAARRITLFWKSQIKRLSSTARSNGLPISTHSHSRSLSRKLFSAPAGLDDDEEAEDSDSRFPTFPFGGGNGTSFGYHSGINDEDGPTSSRPTDKSSERKHIRKVSRVWAWEKGGGFLSGGGEGGSGRTLSSEEMPFVGPFYRAIVRPALRFTRLAFRRLGGSFVLRVLQWLGSYVLGDGTRDLMSEVGQVAWVGLAWWFAIGAWFLL